MNAIAQLWGEIQELFNVLITLVGVLVVLSVIYSVFGHEIPYKCYSEGRIVAEGTTSWGRDKPEWHGEGYTKLPNGRVIKGECR